MNEIKLIDDIYHEDDRETIDVQRDSHNIQRRSQSTQKTGTESHFFLFERNPNSVRENIYESNLRIDSVGYMNKTVEHIYKKNNNFSHVNPMRVRRSIMGSRTSLYKQHTKETAIKELITNLKTQYILFNIRNFVRNYQIKSNKNINKTKYKISRLIRNMSLYIYGFIMLFERPWFCYEGTTIPLPRGFNFIEKCEESVAFNNIPFLYNNALRIIEIILTFTIAVTQILKYKVEYSLKETNTGVNKFYNIIQIILFSSLFLCIVDSIISLCLKKFPIINFICRPFIYVYMIKRLRINWINILKVLWRTKKAYFVLFTNLMLFSVIGHVLFKNEGVYFNSFGESVLQLYILLSTCNFPDIMLDAMKISKFAIIYFVICLSINYFILLSYLNNLYTTKYYKVNKRDCLNIIRDVIDNKKNKFIFNVPKFTSFLLKQKYIYQLSNDEYTNILVLLNLYNRNSDLYHKLVKVAELTPEAKMVENTRYGKYVLRSIKLEIIVNIIYIICTFSIFLSLTNIYYLIFQFIASFCIIYEPIILITNIGIKRFIKKHFNRTLFHIFNVGVIICLIYLLFLDSHNEKEKPTFDLVFGVLKIFISLRTIRIFVFLDKFRIIKNIYIIIRISKDMLNRNILTLYSFILFFSTLSILLTGGNIKKGCFDGDEIPKNYESINFNDFASSYIACFCLIMINNLNILVKSLTFQSRHKMFFEFYFATFYFFATLILINIIQTLLLEMYLISDQSLSDKQLTDKNKDKISNDFKIELSGEFNLDQNECEPDEYKE